MAEMGPGLRGCIPIPKFSALTLMAVIPAKAGTQGFQSLAPGSPLSRGRRIWLSAGIADYLFRREDVRVRRALNHLTESEH